ncbi:MAG: threonine aldolase family protein [Planctomycetaceae bacterium]
MSMKTQPRHARHFASDNYAGMCPEAMEAFVQANMDHAVAYGNDRWTAQAADLIRETFETDCEVFFVFNGTAANSLVLASLCQSYHSILCHELAHIETDECGAPEFFSNGTKLLQVRGDMGKLDLKALEQAATRRQDVHFPKPRVISITQATEVGTVYSADEIGAISQIAKGYGLHLHMDGARFANAVASLGVAPSEITWKVGVEALCFGGTKNGTHVGDAVVFFDRDLAYEFEYRCKQAGQLCSKMRFMSAPWVGMLQHGAWLKHASHANQMADLLSRLLSDIPGVRQIYPRQANSVFVELGPASIDALRAEGWLFYTFIGTGGCRLMCAWDTQVSDVQQLAAAIARCTGA